MRGYLFNILLLFVSLLFVQRASAQQMLRGVVKDEQGKPVVAANIILRQHENASILAFGISNERGEFSVKIPSNLDSLFVMITHLSYATKKFYVEISQPFLEVVVDEQKYELPELVVKNDPVIRRGDTLIFDVSKYRDDADQNIEQLLHKIPGVTVKSSGQILYDGLPISKFYIEGLDMLEGRYRIATRNLSIDAIRDIEVIEHHQPVRALDSLVRPDNAAINLRLKSNIAFTGSLEGGVGASPALYLGSSDIFGFTTKQQFNVSASANNIGENQRANFQNLYSDFTNANFNLIDINKVYSPLLLKENFYLNNREFAGGFNYLRKLSEHTELKWQGSASKDRIRSIGTRELRYTNGETEVLFSEILQATEQPLDLSNRLIFELNAKKLFLRADVNAELNIIESVAQNQVNGTFFPEDLRQHNLNIFANLTAIIRRKKKAYQINSDITYKSTDYDLTLMPADIFTSDFPTTRFQEALQTARQNELHSHTYSSLFFKSRDINGQVNMGIDYKYTTLDTDILTRNDTTENELLGSAFQNDNWIRELTPYVNQVYKKEIDNSIWTLRIPLSSSSFNIQNKINEDISSFHVLMTNPSLEYLLKLPHGNYWNIGYAFQQDYDRLNTLFYEGYIIRSNRNIANSIVDINQFRRYDLYTGFSGKNIEKGTEYNMSIALSQITYDFLNNNNFNQLGLASTLTAGKNTVRRLSTKGSLVGALGSNINFDIRTSYSFSTRQNVVNGEQIDIQNHFFIMQPKFYYTLSRSILSFKSSFQIFANSFSKTPTYQASTELLYFIELDIFGSFRASYNQYLTATGGRRVWNELLNIEYKYSLEKWKFDLSVHMNNLTNNVNYVTFSQSAFSENLSYFGLRPRQVILRLIKRF